MVMGLELVAAQALAFGLPYRYKLMPWLVVAPAIPFNQYLYRAGAWKTMWLSNSVMAGLAGATCGRAMNKSHRVQIAVAVAGLALGVLGCLVMCAPRRTKLGMVK